MTDPIERLIDVLKLLRNTKGVTINGELYNPLTERERALVIEAVIVALKSMGIRADEYQMVHEPTEMEAQ